MFTFDDDDDDGILGIRIAWSFNLLYTDLPKCPLLVMKCFRPVR